MAFVRLHCPADDSSSTALIAPAGTTPDTCIGCLIGVYAASLRLPPAPVPANDVSLIGDHPEARRQSWGGLGGLPDPFEAVEDDVEAVLELGCVVVRGRHDVLTQDLD